MSFVVTRLNITDFRNIVSLDLEPDKKLTVIVGSNATGKTNTLEAVSLLTRGLSFRSSSWSDLVRWSCDEAQVSLEASDGARFRTVSMRFTSVGRRTIEVNGKRKGSFLDSLGVIPSVLFTPDALRMVKGSPGERRDVIDSVGSQLSRTYAQLKADYEKVVRQRNRILRGAAADSDQKEIWDERLVALGSRLSEHRRGLFARLENHAAQAYASISGQHLQMKYVPGWERDGIAVGEKDTVAALEAHLAAKRSEEEARGTTIVGPHRDDVTFLIDGRNAREFASQGQQRSVALAFKIAEVEVISEVSGTRPLLMLDDVMSELDETRRTALTGLLQGTTQTFITTTNIGYFNGPLLDGAKVVTMP